MFIDFVRKAGRCELFCLSLTLSLPPPLLSINIFMNFFIGDDPALTGFTQVAPELFLDKGWSNVGDIWYKGYSTDCTIAERLDDIVSGYKPSGKWCVIQDGTIYHPVLRGFPVHYFENNFTTLKLAEYQSVVYDTPQVPIITEDDVLTIEEAAYQIGNILVENVENFYRYNNPKNVMLYLSAGLDTHTCWTVHDQVTTDYTLRADMSNGFDARPKYTNDVINSLINNYAAYRQIVIQQDSTWTNSGFYAEPYTFRDLGHIIGYANYLGKTSIEELFTENDYCYRYITRPSLVRRYEVFKNKIDASTPKKLREHLWSTIWQVHQMWHVDNTMIFSPFADLRISEIAFRLSIEDMVRCIGNGDLQRLIINRFTPDRAGLISEHKNTGDVWYNFKKNFKRSMLGKDTNFIVQ